MKVVHEVLMHHEISAAAVPVAVAGPEGEDLGKKVIRE
jgi:hypothetical protein